MIKSRKSAIMESTLARIIIGALFLAVAIAIYLIFSGHSKTIIASSMNFF
jgi:hypothetical protein